MEAIANNLWRLKVRPDRWTSSFSSIHPLFRDLDWACRQLERCTHLARGRSRTLTGSSPICTTGRVSLKELRCYLEWFVVGSRVKYV